MEANRPVKALCMLWRIPASVAMIAVERFELLLAAPQIFAERLRQSGVWDTTALFDRLIMIRSSRPDTRRWNGADTDRRGRAVDHSDDRGVAVGAGPCRSWPGAQSGQSAGFGEQRHRRRYHRRIAWQRRFLSARRRLDRSRPAIRAGDGPWGRGHRSEVPRAVDAQEAVRFCDIPPDDR